MSKVIAYRFYQRIDRPSSGVEAEMGTLVIVDDSGEMFDVETNEPWAPGQTWELVDEFERSYRLEQPLAGGGGAVC